MEPSEHFLVKVVTIVGIIVFVFVLQKLCSLGSDFLSEKGLRNILGFVISNS